MPISIDTALLSLYREIWLLVPLEGPISDYSFPFNCLSQDYWFPFKCLSQTMFQALNKDLKWSKAHASRKLMQAWPINSVYAVKTCCLFLLLITWITFHSSSDGYMQTHFSCKVVLTGIHWFGHHMQVRVSHFSSHSTHSLPVSLRLQMASKRGEQVAQMQGKKLLGKFCRDSSSLLIISFTPTFRISINLLNRPFYSLTVQIPLCLHISFTLNTVINSEKEW